VTGIEEAARAVAARGESKRRAGRDPVNVPMIRNWVEAIGDTNPVHSGPEPLAPPAMVQVWTMPGLHGERGGDDPLGAMVAILDKAGFTSVVATNSEQTYHRYLRPGEAVEVTSRLDDVVGPKRTALGEGWFVTTRSTWYVGDEPVAEMLFRILKFRPATKPAGEAIRPAVNRDTEFFWAGTARGELRIQRCGGCGRLRHPPGPMCPECGEAKPEFVVASGLGEVYSYVVHHHPPVPGRSVPFVVALVELDEGVRMLAELVDVPPSAVHIGLPVVAGFVRVDESLSMPVWRPR
jgi:3-oxo-4,17-pregnadiene-20-carboxyl-CoA hydratase alpha subunit